MICNVAIRSNTPKHRVAIDVVATCERRGQSSPSSIQVAQRDDGDIVDMGEALGVWNEQRTHDGVTPIG
jgi:hypothetical protein